MAHNTQYSVAFIGGGNMAQALIGGLLSQGVKASSIMVSEPVVALREHLKTLGVRVTDSNQQAISAADVIVLAVKPQVMPEVLRSMGNVSDRLIISIAAGLTTTCLTQLLGVAPRLVRAMPNTPALIQSGATGLYAAPNVSAQDRALAERILGTAGMVLWVEDESLMDAVTAVSGSGPAYFFYLMEAMIQAGISLGLDEKASRALTLQTALGAAQMAITSEATPDKLRQNVTSPGGTTQAALDSLNQQDVSGHVVKALQAAAARSLELAQQFASQAQTD